MSALVSLTRHGLYATWWRGTRRTYIGISLRLRLGVFVSGTCIAIDLGPLSFGYTSDAEVSS